MLKPIVAAVSLSVVLAAPALAQVVIDYRDPAALEFTEPEQWSDIAATIGDGVVILGEVSGAFSEAGVEQVAYVVSDDVPTAADPFPELNQRIVTFEDGELAESWSLQDLAFARPVTAVDVDGDGVYEVVLEGSFFNMGTLGMGLSVVKLADGVAEIIQDLPDVYIDSCGSGVGEEAITASVVSVSDGQLVAEADTTECP
ncbi:hypothetical protein [Devosia rhizoryzae]|uniref:VCBS repeat-containing protein n=1 Tax=Devosia rhizoryzae TaxID=2774137 RepID=A0ABX7C877_9HYPH|nr:hypothetical protein [Devosia rhizoryzae]QQR39947.1 hypothetical protein JI748_02720 [Devosia rhizoryzae]